MVGRRGVRRWSARWYLAPLLLALGTLASLALAAALVRVSYVQDPHPVVVGDRLTITASGVSLLADEGGPARCALLGDRGTLALEAVGGAVATSTGSWVHAAATPVGVDAGTYTLDCPAESRPLFAAHRVAYLEAGLAGLTALALYLCTVISWAVVLFARNRPGARP